MRSISSATPPLRTILLMKSCATGALAWKRGLGAMLASGSIEGSVNELLFDAEGDIP
jgi:hypothetical protein